MPICLKHQRFNQLLVLEPALAVVLTGVFYILLWHRRENRAFQNQLQIVELNLGNLYAGWRKFRTEAELAQIVTAALR